MTFWLLLSVNSITFGALLFLLAAGFTLIFGLMRIPNLTHGSLFMLGAYFGATFVNGMLGTVFNFWVAALLSAALVAVFGALIERLLLRQVPGQPLAQVLVTLGISFMVADVCLMAWGGDPIAVRDAGKPARHRAHRAADIPALSHRRHRHRRRRRHRALALARQDPHRRHDPRRRRRSRHGARGRHPRVGPVHHRVRARRRACRLCRHHRRRRS